MNQPNLTVYGATWCGDCRRTKRFLDSRNVAYTWVDLERESEAAAVVERVNGGMRSIPTLIFADGSTLVEPSDAELARKLGLAA